MRLVALFMVIASAAQSGHELSDRDEIRGSEIYAEHCATCHGANLEGQPDWRSPGPDGVLPAPPHDETGHTWHHDNATLFFYTKLGGAGIMEAKGMPGFASGMPAFGGTLSDADILDVLGYIRSTWPERAKEVQASRNPPHR